MARTKGGPRRKSRSISKAKDAEVKDNRTLGEKACDCVRKVRENFVLRSLSHVLKSKEHGKRALASNSDVLTLKERKALRGAPYGICTKSVYNTRSKKGPGRYDCKKYDRTRWTLGGLRALLYLKDVPYRESDTKKDLIMKLESK
jgi:hypothetical protein